MVTRINEASGYVQSRQTGITSTEKTLIKHAENELKQALEKTNNFFKNEWPEFKNKMENLDLSVFKKVESFSLN